MSCESWSSERAARSAPTFYTQQLGFEVRQDVPMGPEMRWLTVAAPGDSHELLLAAVDHHIPPVDREAMRDAGVRDPSGNHLRLGQPLGPKA